NVDDPPGAVGLTTQSSQGPIQDPRAAELLPGMMVPRLTKFAVSYDPTCEDSSCEMSSMQVNHCQGEEYIRYVRFGDGLGVWLEHLAGDGCA
ncbi:MAG: hypothetical protein KDD42_04740, partial [Bdellovibrionales bacterium]|nr:hypothetical protein [Bdellovibrionales bacterium]